MSPGITKRRLFGIDRSGPAPAATRKGQPLNPWTIPNVIGYLRLLGIPVFLILAFSSTDGQSTAAVILFAVIGWSDYLDGFAARLTGQYSRLGALLDPIVDRLLVISGMAVCFHFELLPRWAIIIVVARELFMLVISRYALRRGIDIERPQASGVLQRVTVAEVMQRFSPLSEQGAQLQIDESGATDPATMDQPWADLIGAVADIRRPQALFDDETLDQALRQLVLYGPSGLPVLSHDGERLLGWITRQNVLSAIAQRVGASAREIEQGALAGEYARPDAEAHVHTPSTPLDGYQLVEIVIGPHSPALGQRLDEISWPLRTIAAAVTEGREIVAPRPDLKLRVGERVVLLAPAVRRASDTEALTLTDQ